VLDEGVFLIDKKEKIIYNKGGRMNRKFIEDLIKKLNLDKEKK
jgi:hypothetical protein